MKKFETIVTVAKFAAKKTSSADFLNLVDHVRLRQVSVANFISEVETNKYYGQLLSNDFKSIDAASKVLDDELKRQLEEVVDDYESTVSMAQVLQLTSKFPIFNAKKLSKAAIEQKPTASQIRLFQTLQKHCMRFRLDDAPVISFQRQRSADFNEHDRYWVSCGKLLSQKRFLDYLVKGFVRDIESKFIRYCHTYGHRDFSLVQAWKAICLIQANDRKIHISNKIAVIQAMTHRWIKDQQHMSDSQQLFIYGNLCKFWASQLEQRAIQNKHIMTELMPLHRIVHSLIFQGVEKLEIGHDCFSSRNDKFESH